MNMREFALLGVLNMAPFLDEQSNRPGFWVTTEEIVRTIRVKENLEDECVFLEGLDEKAIGYMLRRMRAPWPVRGAPLVDKRRVRGVNQWKQSKAALRACIL